jgi:hypothetical protein
MIPHLLRCQGFAVVYYGFTLGRLESGASSTFAKLRCMQSLTLNGEPGTSHFLYRGGHI